MASNDYTSLSNIFSDLDIKYDNRKNRYRTFCTNLFDDLNFNFNSSVRLKHNKCVIKINMSEYKNNMESILANSVINTFCSLLSKKSYMVKLYNTKEHEKIIQDSYNVVIEESLIKVIEITLTHSKL